MMDKDDLDEMEMLEDEISALEDDVKRYREALEQIADLNYDEPGTMRRIASEALKNA